MKKMWSKTPKLLKRTFLFLLLCVTLGVSLFCVSLGIVLAGSRDTILGEPEIMIILGCQVMDWGPSQSLADRLDKALTYLETSPDMTIIVSGGQGGNEPCTEAYAMAEYLISHGIDQSQIHQEGNSRNTHQNLSFSIQWLEDEGLTGDVVIVSSGFHLIRAKLLWYRVGGDISTLSQLAAPVTDLTSMVKSHFREPLALVKSFLFDQGRVPS